MKIIETPFDGLFIVEPKVFGDERGFFFESYTSQRFFDATGLKLDFVQDNHSRSERGVLRGLHYQLPPMAQGKLVRVVIGEVFDVAVDIRKNSETFGQWFGLHLSAENRRQLWVPPGFAHGFIALSNMAEFLYKTTAYYAPELERCIAWDDPLLNIDWHYEGVPSLSAKDQQGMAFTDAEVFA